MTIVTGFYSGAAAPPRAREFHSPQCDACKLYRGCNSPKMLVNGRGRRKILVVGEAPGKDEDEQGVPFVGKAGQLLRREMSSFDVDLEEDCWVTNCIICRPPRNRTPTDKEVSYCRPNLLKAVRELKPEKVLLFGKTAVQGLIGWLWREDVGPMARWLGWHIPERKTNAWVCPLWHPSYVSREQGDYDGRRGKNAELVMMLFRQHLKAALELEGRPWPKGPPDVEKRVEVCMDVRRAAQFLRGIVEKGGRVAFDYETNMKKPWHPEARIHTCAVCWNGRATVAYPWDGEAIAATRELLVSDLPKSAHNLKFEDEWTLEHLGVRVKNWSWCSMQAAHVLDNRQGITSLKFQALVKLGVGPYDEDISPFLKSDKPGGYAKNRIDEAPLDKLLLYNGADAYLEYRLEDDQREEMAKHASDHADV